MFIFVNTADLTPKLALHLRQINRKDNLRNYFYSINVFVFQNVASNISDEDENDMGSGSLIIPDMNGNDFAVFL